jgi:hypothetical protein
MYPNFVFDISNGWPKHVAVRRVYEYKANFTVSVCICWYRYGMVKESYQIAGLDGSFRLQVVESPRISRQPSNESGNVCSPTHRLSLPYTRDNLGTLFC